MLKKISLVIIAITLILGVHSTVAKQITVEDSTMYWGVDSNGNYMPGWDSTKSWSSGDATIDATDHVGHPNLTSVTITIDDDGFLTDIAFDYEGTGGYAGDVFIDVDGDYLWDYVIAGGFYESNWPNNYNLLSKGIYRVEDVSAFKNVNDDYYVTSDSFYNAGYRAHHPVYLKDTAPVTLISSTFTFHDFPNEPVEFTDLGQNIYIGDNSFIIAFTETCANDVIMERIPVPEPTTLVFLGLSLIGLAISSKKIVV